MPVEYTLRVPRTARVEVEVHESEIQVQGLNGPAALGTHDGSIRLTDQSGATEIESHDGPIQVEGHSGPLAVSPHDSSIRLRSVDGRVTIDARDSEIDAEDLRGGLEVDTHEESGWFAFARLTGDVDISTDDGDFEIRT